MNLSDKVKEKLNEVVKQFESGDISPLATVPLIRLDPKSPASKWSFNNKILAYMQGNIDSRGYKQWQEVGRQVNKGSKASYILGRSTKKVKKVENGVEVEKEQFLGYFPIPVFPIDMTEGEPVESYAPKSPPPLMDVAKALGVKVNYIPFNGDAVGSVNVMSNEMFLSSNCPATFFHELAHIAHNKIVALTHSQDEHQEVVAELTAAVLMQMYGIRDNTGNAWLYISSYSKDSLTAISKAVGDVDKVLSVIFASQVC